MHFKVNSSNHLSAQGTCWRQVSASNDVSRSPPHSVSPLSIKHLHEVSSPAEFKCCITFSSTYCIETYSYASNRRQVMRRDDRVPGLHVHLPQTASQVSGTRDRNDEDEHGKKNGPPLPSPRGWFTSYGPFLLHSTVIERRLDGADCFRHQTPYSPSIRAVTFCAASYVESFLDAFSEKKGKHCVSFQSPTSSSPSNLPRFSIPQSTDAHWDVRALFSPLSLPPFSLPLLFFLFFSFPFLYR